MPQMPQIEKVTWQRSGTDYLSSLKQTRTLIRHNTLYFFLSDRGKMANPGLMGSPGQKEKWVWRAIEAPMACLEFKVLR